MKIELSRDWTEFLSALISHRVRFVIVGGHAVAGHGEPRLTEDLDVFVQERTVRRKTSDADHAQAVVRRFAIAQRRSWKPVSAAAIARPPSTS